MPSDDFVAGAAPPPLLAARLVLRAWHSVHFSLDVTRRVHDFLAATASPQHADVQVISRHLP